MTRGPRLTANPLVSLATLLLVFATSTVASAQENRNRVTPPRSERSAPPVDKFRQLEEALPTPNDYRAASGAPGHRYWQQQADYKIAVTIDDERQRLIASETITYHNNSPDTLRYLWVQLEANIFAPKSDSNLTRTAPNFEEFSYRELRRLLTAETFDGSMSITKVAASDGTALPHTINKTMMRIDLPKPLSSGQSTEFSIDWNYTINDAKVIRARTGYEYFKEDDNYLYEMAHWFPRMAAYTDVNGWQHKQFIGSGEFTLEFGDYEVQITVPNDHIVASTGVLQNPNEVLTAQQRERLVQARTAAKPMFIVTPEEAKAAEKGEPSGTKTWTYHAENVRDFAFATSRKFIWDAKLEQVGGSPVWAMSYFPNEGEPLWSRYSTHAIIHTLHTYSEFTFKYPYPVAISVNGPIGGMEYPMICFNGPRPEEDGTYSKRTKYGLIGVIIHEVGHNWFPMIVNSDERQWTWMDEGLNTFVQYISQCQWEDEYPNRRGEPRDMVDYMVSENQVPIMTNSESILQFGPNAYGKPATALNVLRETILGRELFDFAFKEYSRRWMFKRPQPADLFRTLEDASAVDLDWFWRGWFYSTDHVDLSIEDVRYYTLETGDPAIDLASQKEERDGRPTTVAAKLNKALPKRLDAFPELADFYNHYDKLDVTPKSREEYEELLEKLEDHEKALLKTHRHFYAVNFENLGGLVMPVLLEIEYEGGTVEEMRIPAEVWRRNPEQLTKLFMTHEKIVRISLDPHEETADANLHNNNFPRKPIPSRFELFKRKKDKNPMQQAQEAEEKTSSTNGDRREKF